MAPPSAASATRAKDPPGNSPAADWSHGEAGIDQLDRPGEASSGTSPKRWWIGGSGTARSMKGRICSCGGRPNSHGCSRYANRPRTGSSLITRSRIRGPSAPRARRQLTAGSSRGERPTPDRPTGLHLLLPGALGARPHVPMTTVTTRRVVERVGVEDRDGSKQRIRVLVADAEAVELTGVHRPDVAVIDVNMPGGGGPHATREIRLRSPNTRVLALSASQDHEAVLEMLRF